MNDARKVLMIDDSKLIRKLGRSVLERSGFIVWTAENFAEVEQTVRENGAPDMLLVDINMPEMTGDDLVPLLRERIGLNAPVVLFSDIDEEELKARAMNIGAAGWISKHWGLQRLVQDITDILEWTTALQPSATPPRNVVTRPTATKIQPPPDVKPGGALPTKAALNPATSRRASDGAIEPITLATASEAVSALSATPVTTSTDSASASDSATRTVSASASTETIPTRPTSGTRRLLNDGEEYNSTPLRASKAPTQKSKAPAPPSAEGGAEPTAADFEDDSAEYTTPPAPLGTPSFGFTSNSNSNSKADAPTKVFDPNEETRTARQASTPTPTAHRRAADTTTKVVESDGAPPPDGPQILLVDDSDLIRNLVSRALVKAGYRVAIAARFEELSQVLLDIGEPDLILVDINMPDILGDDLVVFFRRRWEIQAPIVLFSNVAEGELDYRAKEAGANGWISKRWGIDRLVAEVAAFIPRPPGAH